MGSALNPAIGPIRTELPWQVWVARARGWLRRLASAPVAGEAALCLEARVTLGPKKSLVLVYCHGKRVLLAVSGDAITPVMEMAAPRRSSNAVQGRTE